MRFFSFYGQCGVAANGIARKFYERVKKPFDTARADGVIGGFEPQEISDVVTAVGRGVDECIAEHLRPDLIEFGHMARIGLTAPKGNNVILF